MSQWKLLLVLEKFENDRLTEIVPAAFRELGFKSTFDLPTWKLPKVTAKK